MKKLLSLLVACALLVSAFAGCSEGGQSSQESSSTSVSESTGSQSGAGEDSASEDSGSETASTSNAEQMDLVVAYPLINGVPADNQMIQDEINKIVTPKYNDVIQLMPISMGNYNQQMQLMLSSGEKLDLFVIRGEQFNSYLSSEQLTDMTDLIQEYGQGIIEAVGQSFIDAGKANGSLYGITTNRDLAIGHGGLMVRKDILEELGYTKEDIQTVDDLDALFADVHAAYPDMLVLSNNAGGTLYGTLGMCFDPLTDGFAVLRNFGEDLEVVNAFATEEYQQYCEHARRWYEAGYISADIAANTESGSTMVKSGRAFSYVNRVKPGVDMQETKMAGTEIVGLQTMPTATYTSVPQSFMWGIPYSADDPARSMEYLNEVYTNADIMNLLAWGVEGVHYDVMEDGHITTAASLDGAESGYNPSAGWIFGNQFITYVWEGDDLDLYDQLKEFNDTAQKSAAFGFTFNNQNVVTEIAAVQSVYDQYKMGLECGLVDPAEALPEMLAQMESAGIQKIIDEKQAQLDEWAAAQ